MHQVERAEDSEDEEYFVDSIDQEETSGQKSEWWMVPLEVNQSIIPFKLDTGSDVNIISYKDYNSLKDKPKLLDASVKLTAYAGGEVPVKGRVTVRLRHKESAYKALLIVSSADVQPILGLEMCQKLNLVKRVWTVVQEETPSKSEQKASTKGRVTDTQPRKTERNQNSTMTGQHEVKPWLNRDEIYNKYKDVFTGLGCLPGKHTIKLKKDAMPVVEPCRKVPFTLHEKLKAELERMERDGVITKVTEPTEWVSSLVIVHKPNGNIHVCLDPRNLNKAIKREHYKLSTREEIAAKFSSARLFSKFDASRGFWQLKLDKASSFLCTFNTPSGRYRVLRVPFGISSAPEVFHRTIHEIFEHIPGVDTSMDDVLVGGANAEEHDDRVIQVLEAARRNKLTLNWLKCQLGMEEPRV